jgi:DNA-binding NarL/FixJ family response regulator
MVGVEQLTGRQLKAKARLEDALGELGDEPSPSSVTLKIALSTNGIYLDEREEMFTWGLEAVKDAEDVSDPLLTAAANSALTLGSAFTGRLDVALEHVDKATQMIDSLSDEELAKGIDAIGSLAGAELYLDRFQSSGNHGERGIRVARETGQGELIAMLHPALGTSLWVLGELERSREVLGAALESARLSKNAQAIAWAAFNLEYVALITGDLDDALALGEESVELTESMGDGLVSSHAGVVHGAALIELGRHEEGIELLTRRAGDQGQKIAPGPWRATYLEDLVRGRVALGQLELAAESARCTREQADRVPLPVAHVMASRAEALVLLAQGQGHAAAELALSAVEAAESIGAKPAAATSMALAGRSLLAAGDKERAGELLERAASEYDSMGAPRYRDEIDGELRQAGLRSAKKSKRGSGAGAGLDSLTGRELEVAHLVRDRRTNKEIAGELFLSLKTVESHVRNIFGKLGVSSRVEIARAMEARSEAAQVR